MDFNPGDYVRPSDAARALSISTRHVLRLADRGALHVVMTPLGRLISRASVARLAKARAEDSHR